MFSGLYSNASGFSDAHSFLGNWAAGHSDPLENRAASLAKFCFPNASTSSPDPSDAQGFGIVKGILTADGIKHYLGLYRHFQSHWPLVHNISFDPFTAYDGLVLSLVCVGAVYSDRLGVDEVRWLMEIVRSAIYRSAGVYKSVARSNDQAIEVHPCSQMEVEEIQSLVHMCALFIWHGNQKQRQQGRGEFWAIAKIVRRYGLVSSLPIGHQHYSALHQPGPITGNEVNVWSWDSWVEQEKRARLMYLIFLMDAALTIYFNEQPHFDVYELQLPLPADDAAWEARSEEACASALGLRGHEAQGTNNAGSRRPKQLAMSEAVRLLYQGGDFPQRATNAFSKFILIHAIHVQIYRIQRQILNIGGGPGFPSSGTSTPTEGQGSGGSSGYATPTEGSNHQFSQASQMLRQTVTALELWKRLWDADMQLQYPAQQPRIGFCRDGVHYYFLAKLFLRSSRREEWAAPADVRCRQIFHLLKQIRAHVASDAAAKGIDIGSVTTVDDSYGVAELTLNMKLLFTPVSTSP